MDVLMLILRCGSARDIIFRHIEIMQIRVDGEPLKHRDDERDRNQHGYQSIGRAKRAELQPQEEERNRYERITYNFRIELETKRHNGVKVSCQKQENCIQRYALVPHECESRADQHYLGRDHNLRAYNV